MSSRPTIVLVHGAFANAGCWAKLVPLMRAKGFSVVASHCPLSSLADDAPHECPTSNTAPSCILIVRRPASTGAVITEAGNESQVRGRKDYPVAPGATEIKPYSDNRFALTLEGFRRRFERRNDHPGGEARQAHLVRHGRAGLHAPDRPGPRHRKTDGRQNTRPSIEPCTDDLAPRRGS
jgi:hypothetical protein